MLQISLILSNTRWFPFFSSRKQLLFDSQSHQTSSSAPPQLWLRKGRICCITFHHFGFDVVRREVLFTSIGHFSNMRICCHRYSFGYVQVETICQLLSILYKVLKWSKLKTMGSTSDVKQQSGCATKNCLARLHQWQHDRLPRSPMRRIWLARAKNAVVFHVLPQFRFESPCHLVFMKPETDVVLHLTTILSISSIWFIYGFLSWNALNCLQKCLQSNSFYDSTFRQEFQFQISDVFMVSKCFKSIYEVEKTTIRILCCSYSQTQIKGH